MGGFLVIPVDCPGITGKKEALETAVKEGRLLGYRYYTPRIPAGRSWSGLFVLHFADWNLLGKPGAWPDTSSACQERVAVIAEAPK